MNHVKLHIPGPVEVSEKTFRAFCSPMIGHRGQGFKDLYARVQPQLQALFYTKQLVFLSTSSAWGVMEGAIRNLVSKKVLNCMCGAFSDKWLDVSRRCGKEAEALQVPWGSPVRAEAVDKKLASGQFDALTLIHNETSTGVMSPLQEIAGLKHKYPDVMFIVDAVSSMSAVPLKFEELGIDVLLAGTQKALAMPPGMAVFVCSPAALAKAAKLEDLLAEGRESRYGRHQKTNQMTRDWATRQGFNLFPEPGFESVTLTCINNGAKTGGRKVDVPKLQML